MSGQGSAGNVIAALCSFFIPGLGQLVQGRILAAIIHVAMFIAVLILTFGLLTIIVNLFSCYDAAVFKKA
jgi:TM2 domain-containing membrane protein YozV